MCIVLIVCTYSAYSTVLHTTVGPLNVYKKIRGTDYAVFVLIKISIDIKYISLYVVP